MKNDVAQRIQPMKIHKSDFKVTVSSDGFNSKMIKLTKFLAIGHQQLLKTNLILYA